MVLKFDVEVNDGQRSNNPQNGFVGRNEDDIEELLDNMVIVGEDRDEDIQWDRVVNDVEDINSSQDDDIRGVDQILRQDSDHGDHNENPIRMWANPNANDVLLQPQHKPEYKPGEHTILSDQDAVAHFNRIFNNEEPINAQIAAEEYYLNQNSEALGSFEDIGNIKWAILEDEGAHREEAPNNRGEHLNTDTNTQYDIHGFYIEEDGEPLEPEEVNSLMKKIGRRDQLTVPNSEPSEVPEIMLEYNSVEEAVSDRDLEREEFDSEYVRAQEIGLVNEEGNLTLKGLLSGANLEARDLRSLEEVVHGESEIGFHSLNHETVPLLRQEDISSYQVSLTVSTDNRELSNPIDTTGRVQNGEIEPSLADEINNVNDALDHEIESVSEDSTETYKMSLGDYLQTFENLNVSENVFLDNLEDAVAAEVAQAALRTDEPKITGPQIEQTELEFDPESELGHTEWSSALSYEVHELREEIETNTTLYFEDGTLNLDYKGPNNKLGQVIETFSSKLSSWKIDNDEPVGAFSDTLSIDELYLKLQEVRNDLEGHLQFDDSLGYIGRKVSDYDRVSERSKQKIDELEDQGLIETETEVVRNASFDITASSPLEYRELLSELEEIEGNLDYMEEPASSSQRAQVSLEHVYTKIESLVDDEEKIREELDGFRSELIDLHAPASMTEEVELKDYEKPQNDGLTHKVNKLVDNIDNDYLTSAIRTLVDEPEPVEKREHKRVFSEMDHKLREYEVREHHTRPSEKLLEKLDELYDRGIIEAERVIEEPYADFEHETFRDPLINREVTVDGFLEMDEEHRDKLYELDERGLINFEDPTRTLTIDKNYAEAGSLRFDLGIDYRLEKLDIGGSEVEVEVDHQTEGPYVYEENEQIEEVAQAIDPLASSEPYENIEVETGFEYTGAQQPAAV